MEIRTYIAAPFSYKMQVRFLAGVLEPYDLMAQMRWLNHEFPYPGDVANPGNHQAAIRAAIEDTEDVIESELVIWLTEPHIGSSFGRNFEAGIAYALCPALWIVGEAVNVFSALQGPQPTGCYIRRFYNTAEMMVYIKRAYEQGAPIL